MVCSVRLYFLIKKSDYDFFQLRWWVGRDPLYLIVALWTGGFPERGELVENSFPFPSYNIFTSQVDFEKYPVIRKS